MSTLPHTHVVAVGGSVGTGNDIVLGMLRRLGHCTVDADEIAKQLTQKGNPGYQQILNQIGDRFLDARGGLDRVRLYEAAHAEPRLMEQIRSVVYPLVKQVLENLIQGASVPLVFIKTNDLKAYEIGNLCDRTWIVTASEDAQVADLVKNHNWAYTLARQYARAQTQPNLQSVHAHAVLCNSGTRAGLWQQVIEALRQLKAEDKPDAAGRVTPVPEQTVTTGNRFFPVSPINTQTSLSNKVQTKHPESLLSLQLKLISREFLNIAVILLALTLLTSWGLLLAEYGRQHLPIAPWEAIWQAVIRTGQYLSAHPPTYLWAREQVPWFQLVSGTLRNSAGLLVLSMGLAILLGLPLGIAAATARHKVLSALVMVLSVLGSSTPSFLFAMMLWVVNITVHQSFKIHVLPSTGFGWDAHLIMPALVLAMRPLAQIAQVTYVSLCEVLGQDFVRTAHSKGLTRRAVQFGHVLPNTLIPILNTLGTSLRFSLASLPVVEIFFHWPGVGSMLMDAINLGTAPLVIDLILSLGCFFLIVNLLIEFCFPLIDPRLRREPASANKTDTQTLLESLRELGSIVSSWFGELRHRFAYRRSEPSQLPTLIPRSELAQSTKDSLRVARRKWFLRHIFRNPTLIASSLILIFLIGLATFGGKLTSVNAYQVHGVMAIDGVFAAPPFKPSAAFPWGTDHIGRDIRALVLAGAQRTLSLAFFGVLARLLLGSALGIIAGWRRGGRFDRIVTGAMGIWAAFPATLFAMIVIQALGIQQGMWVFVAGICMVGWGEVAQFVRGQVISLKPRPFIESARSVGARADQILVRHILPNLANPILVLAALEMGGVLMLLAELGFLNVFMGGGFRTMIGESGSMKPIIASYSDVPEWGALIANVREQWRSYQWMALYPGMAVLITIISFNLFGEGLRRFLEDSALSLSRLFNRYTFAAAAGITVIITLVLQSAVPLSVYRAEGLKFDEQRVMEDIRILSSPQLQGRETGTSGASLAALYIARRMSEIGIFPAGERHQYFQNMIQPRLHLVETPALAILDDAGNIKQEFAYRRDFAEVARLFQSRGEAKAPMVGVAYGPVLDATAQPADLRNSEAWNHVIIIRAGDLAKVKWNQVQGILIVADDDKQLERRDLYPYELARTNSLTPHMLITAEVADALLRTAGSSLEEIDIARASLEAGSMKLTGEGATVSMSVQALDSENAMNEAYINVIGVIPGQGHFMGTEEQVIVVSAYYDGPGSDPQGLVYPGANDNASGVAMLLELARLLKTSPYQPDKTVLFVAWEGGERQEGLSVVNVLNARQGASEMNVETVLELSGVGYGTGNSISIANDSSYRLVKLFQEAAGRYRLPTTTRGRGPHYDIPVRSILGGRDAMTLSLSWDGSDELAHTPRDTVAIIDPNKIYSIGRPAYLTLLVLCRETEY